MRKNDIEYPLAWHGKSGFPNGSSTLTVSPLGQSSPIPKGAAVALQKLAQAWVGDPYHPAQAGNWRSFDPGQWLATAGGGRILHRIVSAITGVAGKLFLVPYAFAQATAEPPTLNAAEVQRLSVELRRGGHVLYFRHLDTRQDQEDVQPVNLADCGKQRNLSDAGIRHGRSISEAFRKLQIPVGDVISSPFCRTLDTAKLIAGRATANPDLFFAIALTTIDREKKAGALRTLLERSPRTAGNLLIVGHTANLQEAVGLWPKPEGVAYVFRPDGTGRINPVARIEPSTWAAAARQ